jgi:hypothetical protein
MNYIFHFKTNITGIISDYMIIIKTQFKNVKFFPNIEYFWSLDALNFSKLPHLSSSDISKLQNVQGLFHGQHDRRIFKNENNNSSGNNLIQRTRIIKS